MSSNSVTWFWNLKKKINNINHCNPHLSLLSELSPQACLYFNYRSFVTHMRYFFISPLPFSFLQKPRLIINRILSRFSVFHTVVSKVLMTKRIHIVMATWEFITHTRNRIAIRFSYRALESEDRLMVLLMYFLAGMFALCHDIQHNMWSIASFSQIPLTLY